ncbi:hypothetical protein FOZ62_027354, partial [Perkinsus olseni]
SGESSEEPLADPLSYVDILEALSQQHELDLVPNQLEMPHGNYGITHSGVHEIKLTLPFKTWTGTYNVKVHVKSRAALEAARKRAAEARKAKLAELAKFDFKEEKPIATDLSGAWAEDEEKEDEDKTYLMNPRRADYKAWMKRKAEESARGKALALNMQHVHFDEGSKTVSVTIASSKVDQATEGCECKHLPLPCPLAFVPRKLQRACPGSAVLANERGNRFLKKEFLECFRRDARESGIVVGPNCTLGTHSFRRGGVQLLALGGAASRDQLKLFGRWSSDCIDNYLEETLIADSPSYAARAVGSVQGQACGSGASVSAPPPSSACS